VVQLELQTHHTVALVTETIERVRPLDADLRDVVLKPLHVVMELDIDGIDAVPLVVAVEHTERAGRADDLGVGL
jgi:hypothetical protein